ncbi:Rv3235 family protein [Bifidobacterium sp. UBA744]|uniref:Rv3235 family protein n=1 Tax=Bifidobacterium sp. UBA744 TaxID=1946112 RepID=UPI0025BF4AA3|nr:Rv3235 family protein [Bifidobacterium sp. UBA744]
MSQPDTFEVDLPILPNGQSVHLRICRYVPEDLSKRDCIGLGGAAARLAWRAMDVVRGKLPASRLANAVSPTAARKLETMALLYRGHLQRHPELRQRAWQLPVEPRGIDAVVRASDHVEAWVHLTIAQTSYWSTVIFDYVGTRWMCTALDLG